MIDKILEEVFVNLFREFTEVPVMTEEIRQSFEDGKKFEEGLWIDVVPKTSKAKNSNLFDKVIELECVYGVNLIYEIAPDYYKKNKRIRDLTVLTLPVHTLPISLSKFPFFKNFSIVGDNIRFSKMQSKNAGKRFSCEFNCKFWFILSPVGLKDSYTRFETLIFDLQTRINDGIIK